LVGGVFCCLATLRPDSPGLFSYIHEAFGPGAGFVTAFLYWVTCTTASVAVGLAATGYLSVFVPAVARQPGETIATLGFIWLLIGANYVGPRFVARTQSWTIAIGLVPVFFVAVGGWFFFHAHIFIDSWNVTGGTFLHVVPRSTVMAFWAFLGLESAIVLAPLVRNPARDVPIATLGGLAIASAIYISACAAIMGILPASVLAKSSAPFADAVAPLLGASVAGAVALSAMFKAVGTLGSTVLLTVETADSHAMLGQETSVLHTAVRAGVGLAFARHWRVREPHRSRHRQPDARTAV
jgi:arginine:agmatine antiporter